MTGGEVRSIHLAGQTVAYTLRRSARRSVGLHVDDRGLRVAAPQRLALPVIEQFIHAHGAWVLDKLGQWRERPAPYAIEDGAMLPVLGEPWRLRLLPARSRASWHFDPALREVRLLIPAGAGLALVLERALRAYALTDFAARYQGLGGVLGLPLPPLALSGARTRWGSCSRASGIRLNWRLVFLPPELVDYVVAHELAHLVEMNHSPRFWSVVESLYPDHRRARARLKAEGAAIPRF